MQVAWFFQESAFVDSDVVQNLMYAVQEIGDEVIVGKYLPFGAMTYNDVPKDKPVVVYGSIAMIKDAQRKIPNAPCAWADWPKLRCSSYYIHYNSYLVQQQWYMLPFGSLPHQKYSIFQGLGDDAHDGKFDDFRVFLRPDENTKRFTGSVVAEKQFDRWYNLYKDDCDPEDITVVSAVMPIEDEWRLVVHNGKVITASKYKSQDYIAVEPGCPQEVTEFAEQCCKVWTPHPLFVMDIAHVHYGPRLLEIGSMNCAGFYACDLHKIAAAAHEAAEADWVDENIP